MDDADAVKTGAVFILGGAALGTAVLSRKLHTMDCCLPFVGLANCFASGVFLAVGLTHLLPEGAEILEDEVDNIHNFGFIMVIAGYMLILYCDRVLTSNHSHTPEAFPSSAVRPRNNTAFKDQTAIQEVETPKLGDSRSSAKSTVSMMGLWIALTIHAAIEGVAIGLQEHADEAMSVAIGVLLHKIPAALSLGVRVRDAKASFAWTILIVFSLASPLGIVLGIGLEHLEVHVLVGILLNVCAGTFVYIACSEIIVDEFSTKTRGHWKFLALLLGTVVFVLFSQVTTDEEHEH